VLELADRADSNSAVRKDVWVQVPLAAPGPGDDRPDCRAFPADPIGCVDDVGLGRAYPYLLGLYLGDGMLTLAHRHIWRLRITLDKKYPGIISRAIAAIHDVSAHVAGVVDRQGCVELYSNWKHWLCMFPQHGPGPKYQRKIRLEPWQVRLVIRYPEAFLKGLIESDGCRFLNRVNGYVYPRYMFCNRSDDLRELFAATCALVAVECRPAGSCNMSVARRRSVEILDQFVGPKA
jgi:hypothetical protein